MVKTKAIPQPNRFHPGQIVTREIDRYQQMTRRIIPTRMFRRIIQEIGRDVKKEFHIDPVGMEALQWAAEDYVTNVFRLANKEAMQDRRLTILPVDLAMAVAIEQEDRDKRQETFKAARKELEHEYRDNYYSMPKVEAWEW